MAYGTSNHVNIIGAGLAGCEAAWQVANRGLKVRLYEMKPKVFSPAHQDPNYAELVCSNSFRSNQLENAVGLLKEEMRILNSIIIKCADATQVPAGGALAVDRHAFSTLITDIIRKHPNITVINEEVKSIPDGNVTIIATGPLTSLELSEAISKMIGMDYLHFYDAAAPIVTYDSLDMSKAFRASRYNKGSDDYINCPMNKEEYQLFWSELIKAETAKIKDFEDGSVFEACMPIESMAARGRDTIRFGPLKPVGIIDPQTGLMPYAVVQLRQDDAKASLYNMVGFQTRLKWPEQKRIFRLIPGLEKAEFVRFGVMHKNTYINSPGIIDSTYRMITKPHVYFAGQITGVEGYVESSSSGLVAGINAAMQIMQNKRIEFTSSTAIGALSKYVSNQSIKNFQPMNINHGIMDGVGVQIKDKKQRKLEIAKKALKTLTEMSLKFKNTNL